MSSGPPPAAPGPEARAGSVADRVVALLPPGRLARGAVLAGLYGLVLATFLPGSMTPDTIRMCSEAVADVYTDWHSPVLSGIWGFVDLRPEVLFAGVTALTVVSIQLIVSRWLRPWVAVAATCAIVLFPATLGWMGHIGKDVWFASSFLAGIALMCRAGPARRAGVRRALLVGAGVCFWVAIAARKNAMLPVGGALLVAWPVPPTVFGRTLRPLVRRVLASAAVLVVLVASVTAFGSFVVQPTATHADQSTYVFDLAGMSLAEHEDLYPEGILREGTTLETIDKYFDVAKGDGYFFAEGTPVDPFLDEARVEELRSAWVDAVLEHPIAYLRTRLSYTWALLGLSAPHPQGSVNDGGSRPETFAMECPLRDRYDANLYEDVFGALQRVERTNVWRGWVFTLVLVGAALAAGWTRVAEARALLVGGVLSLAGLALVGISPVFRYSWFTAVCALIAVALALSRVPQLARRDDGDPPEPAEEDPADAGPTADRVTT